MPFVAFELETLKVDTHFGQDVIIMSAPVLRISSILDTLSARAFSLQDIILEHHSTLHLRHGAPSLQVRLLRLQQLVHVVHHRFPSAPKSTWVVIGNRQFIFCLHCMSNPFSIRNSVVCMTLTPSNS